MKRWFKRLWLRYLHYWKEHWIIAASIALTVLWLLGSIVVQLLPLLAEMLFAAIAA